VVGHQATLKEDHESKAKDFAFFAAANEPMVNMALAAA